MDPTLPGGEHLEQTLRALAREDTALRPSPTVEAHLRARVQALRLASVPEPQPHAPGRPASPAEFLTFLRGARSATRLLGARSRLLRRAPSSEQDLVPTTAGPLRPSTLARDALSNVEGRGTRPTRPPSEPASWRTWAAAAAAGILFVLIWRLVPSQAPARLAIEESSPPALGGEFLPLPYAHVPVARGQIVRMSVPRTALASFGLDPGRAGDTSTVLADVFVGEDGIARSVRFVQPPVQEDLVQ